MERGKTGIVPRWEWRSFGTSFGPAESTFAGLDPIGIQESDELYLLSPEQANVKVRDDLLDIKVLKGVNPDGLEQWVPVMKAGFPLVPADVVRLYEALNVREHPLPESPLTLDQVLEVLANAAPTVRPVGVHKKRTRYTIAGCMAEMTDVVVEGRSARTVAIEAEDPDAVIVAVDEVGLQGYVNTNYTEGLTALIDDTPPRYAVIDVGTNSVKFHLAERSADGRWSTVVDRAEVTRLGEDLGDGGMIGVDAVARTAAAIAGMVEEAIEEGVVAIATVGTAGLRMAANSVSVIEEIRRRAGIRVEVISGDEESRLAFLAAKAGLGLGSGSLVVFDTGGGSTQFTFGRGDAVLERFSLNVGAVRYTERFELHGVVTPEVLDQALAAIAEDLALDGRDRPDTLVGMGGTITNITAVSRAMSVYDPDLVQGATVELAEVDRQIEIYRSTPQDARRSIVGLQPKRAEVILAGACIVKTIMERFGHETLTVSDRGLRHGVLQERFAG